MIRTLSLKIARLIATLLCVTFLCFMMVNLLPGDPVQSFNIGAEESKIEEIRHDLGLDKPLPVRYLDWLKNFASGDLGKYYNAPQNASDVAKTSLPVSLQLMVYTQIFALALAIPIGMWSAYKQGGWFDRFAGGMSFLALSIPSFVVAYLLQRLFVFTFEWFDIKWVPFGENPVEHFRGAVLPVVSLGIAQVAVYQRLLRSDMIATLQEDYITMARAKGLKPRRILLRHALRPSSLTLLTVVGINVGTLIGGSVVIERIFRIEQGMGFQLVLAYLTREYVAFQSFVALIAILYVVTNFIVDFLYTVLDPRIRHA